MREYYSITDLTREFGVSTRTIRFYEDEGLIHPVRRGRTRLFRPADRQLLKQILRGKRLGFSIAEIREIIQMYKEPPGEAGQLKLMMKRVEEKAKTFLIIYQWYQIVVSTWYYTRRDVNQIDCHLDCTPRHGTMASKYTSYAD